MPPSAGILGTPRYYPPFGSVLDELTRSAKRPTDCPLAAARVIKAKSSNRWRAWCRQCVYLSDGDRLGASCLLGPGAFEGGADMRPLCGDVIPWTSDAGSAPSAYWRETPQRWS